MRGGGSAAGNPYLCEFVGGGLFQRMRAETRHFSSLSAASSRRLRKEVTEAAAAVAAVERAVGALGRRGGAALGSGGRGLRVVDLCAGKGWTTLFLAHRFPEAALLMLDRDRRRDLRHLAPFPGAASEELDICTAEAERRVREHFSGTTGSADRGVEGEVDGAAGDGPPVTVLLGVHLCGQLSRVAVELWRACGADILLLVPCCLPKQGLPPGSRKYHPFGADVVEQARARGEDPHAAWCRLLEDLVAAPPAAAARRDRDPHVLSPRNVIVQALRDCAPIET